MSNNLATLAVVIEAKNAASPAIQSVKKDMEGLGHAVKAAEGQVSGFASVSARLKTEMGGLGGFVKSAAGAFTGFVAAQVVMGGLSAAAGAAKGSMIGFNDTLDKAKIGFTSMLGSAEAADQMLRDLGQFAKSTPFEFPELVSASQKLLAFGFNAKDIIPTMTAIGDAVANVGGGSAAIDKVTTALGQMATKGKVSNEELLQLAENNIPVYDILAKAFGKTTGEIQKMAEQGVIPLDRGMKALIEGMESRAPGAMQKMSTTWTGAISNIKDSLNQAVAAGFRPFFDLLKDGANATASFLGSAKFTAWAAGVSQAMGTLSSAIRALFSGDIATATVQWQMFVSQMQTSMQPLALLGLKLANAIAPGLAEVTLMFTNLAVNATIWGFNLIVSYGQGMVQAANSILSNIMTSIGNAIAQWIASFSPPKRGPLSQIHIWGANLMKEYFKGMSAADFSALDKVTQSIRDVLTSQLQSGQFDKVDFIPRLLGAQTVVADAIAQWKEFGSVTSDVFTDLRAYIGDAAGDIAGMVDGFLKMGDIDKEIKKVTDELTESKKATKDLEAQLRLARDATKEMDAFIIPVKRTIQDLEREARTVERAYRDQERAIKDQIEAFSEHYRRQLDGEEKVLTAIQRQIKERERALGVNNPALDVDEARAQLAVDQERVTAAQNAHLERAARITKDIQGTQQNIREIEADIAEAKREGRDTTSLTRRLADEQADLAELHAKLAREGVQTEQDKLNVIQAQQRVLQDESDLRKLTDPTLQNLKEQEEQHQRNKDKIEEERDLILGPLQDAQKLLADQREAEVRQITDKIDREKDFLQFLEDEKTNRQRAEEDIQALIDKEQDRQDRLQEQLDGLNEQKQTINDMIGLTATRLSHERELADTVQEQLDLLKQMADAAAKSGGGGGAGGKGGGAGGIGALGGMGIGGGLGLEKSLFPTPEPVDLGGAVDLNVNLDSQIDAEIEKLKKKLKQEMEDAFKEAFSDPKIIGAGLGALLGTVLLGGPWGTLIGAAIGGIVIPALIDYIKENAVKVIAGLGIGLVVAVTAFAWAPVAVMIGAGLLAAVGAISFMEFGPAIIGGIVNGIESGLGALWDFFKDMVRRAVDGLKLSFGIASPSTVMRDEIGKPLIEGLLEGITTAFDAVVTFFTELPGKVLDAIGDLGGTLADAGSALLRGFQDAIQLYWDTVSFIWFGGLATLVFDTIGDVTRSLWDRGTALLQGLQDGVTNLWDTVTSGWFTSLPGAVVGAIGDVARTLWDKGTGLLQGLQNGVVNIWDTVTSGWFTALPGAVVTAIGNVLTTLADKGKDLLTGLLDGAKAIWDGAAGAGESVKGWFGDLGNKIVTTLGDWKSKLTQHGTDLVTGILSGITNSWHLITERLWGLVDALPGPLKKVIEAFSPSKRFAREIGAPIAQGVALGIINETGTAVSAATTMAAATVDAAIVHLDRLNTYIKDAFGITGGDLYAEGDAATAARREIDKRAGWKFGEAGQRMIELIFGLKPTPFSTYGMPSGGWGGLLGGIPQFAEGGFVPKTTMAMVHGGEYVLNRDQTQALFAAMTGQVNNHPTGYVPDPDMTKGKQAWFRYQAWLAQHPGGTYHQWLQESFEAGGGGGGGIGAFTGGSGPGFANSAQPPITLNFYGPVVGGQAGMAELAGILNAQLGAMGG